MSAFLPPTIMLRKRFRKYLPTHEKILQTRAIAWFGPSLRHPNPWHLNRRSVAGGVAVGMFAGLIPGSNPVQFFFAAVGSVLLKVNLPVAVLVTLYSNPFTVVPLYFCAYKLGQVALLRAGDSVPAMDFNPQGTGAIEWMRAAFEWLLSAGKPLLLGLPLLATLLAVAGYLCVNVGWRVYVAWQWRRRRRERSGVSS
jgi:uncharacterized protein